jgi:phenol hydroxylase P1 protein
MDEKQVSVKPRRIAFDHLAPSVSQMQASRYQEVTYNFQFADDSQYRPTWNPAHRLYDPGKTAIVIADWCRFKDPRHFYYGSYIHSRADQQEGMETNFSFVESRGLTITIPSTVRQAALDLLIPLRHVAWGSSLNNTSMCEAGYGAAITQPCLYQAMDNLSIAQYLTRLGLLLADPEELDIAKEAWLNEERWQLLRCYIEESLVVQDWFELMLAQNYVLDGLLYPLVYEKIVNRYFAKTGGILISMLTLFMPEWFKESRQWVDAVIEIAVEESSANRDLISNWYKHYQGAAIEALLPIAEYTLGDDSQKVIDQVLDEMLIRSKKLNMIVSGSQG